VCELKDAQEVEMRLRNLPEVTDVLVSGVGEAARLVEFHLF
jgi:hypothetical protein